MFYKEKCDLVFVTKKTRIIMLVNMLRKMEQLIIRIEYQNSIKLCKYPEIGRFRQPKKYRNFRLISLKIFVEHLRKKIEGLFF